MRDLLKGDRVRIHSAELGNLYGTVYQDHSVTLIGPVLVHIDGTRSTDPRWVRPELLHSEPFPGAHDRSRVGD